MTEEENFTVTPYAVKGDIDYEKLLVEFGADKLTDEQIATFPDPTHPLVRRNVFYAERNVDRFLEAANAGRLHSIVTGRDPSGSMHIGHIFPFYFAKHLQEQTNDLVYIPISDDEKYLLKEMTLKAIDRHTRDNLLDLLAVGFDPDRTRIIVDTADADIVYPLATAFAKEVTQSTVDATYGAPANIGISFYPLYRRRIFFSRNSLKADTRRSFQSQSTKTPMFESVVILRISSGTMSRNQVRYSRNSSRVSEGRAK